MKEMQYSNLTVVLMLTNWVDAGYKELEELITVSSTEINRVVEVTSWRSEEYL